MCSSSCTERFIKKCSITRELLLIEHRHKIEKKTEFKHYRIIPRESCDYFVVDWDIRARTRLEAAIMIFDKLEKESDKFDFNEGPYESVMRLLEFGELDWDADPAEVAKEFFDVEREEAACRAVDYFGHIDGDISQIRFFLHSIKNGEKLPSLD